MILASLIISVVAAAGSATAIWVAVRGRLRVTATLQATGSYLGDDRKQPPLAKLMVNVQGRALTVESVRMEWVSPMPAPISWGWGAPTPPELGLPWGADAGIPLIAELTALLPPATKPYILDGQTQSFTVAIRLSTDEWGDGTEMSGEVRAHVTMSNRRKAYISNSVSLLFRSDLLKAQLEKARREHAMDQSSEGSSDDAAAP